jgi:hypothetical protein
LPCIIPGIGDEMLGAMQQAPQPKRQSMMFPFYFLIERFEEGVMVTKFAPSAYAVIGHSALFLLCWSVS